MTRRVPHNPIRGSRAFTLIEVVVAVGILALIGVLVGTIFSTVGDTVTQGRRVSNMNRFASRIERVMRRDFENMVRENGFLVIRNEITHDYQNNPSKTPVGLTITDTDPRERRIDEIMFFSRGDFSSRRTPLHRDMVARSNAARVYYGHGQRMPVDFGPDPDRPDYTTRYARPRLDEPNSVVSARLGAPSALGTVNPNEFAADWSLLRHVTVLSPRQGGLQDVPDDVFGLEPNKGSNWLDYRRVADSSRQVALGPAAQSVFRSVAHMEPFENVIHPKDPDQDDFILVGEPGFNIRPVNAFAAVLNNGTDGPEDGTMVRPLFTSGIVDVAVTDLDEIRTTVTSTWFGAANNAAEWLPTDFTPFDYTDETDRLTDYEQERVLFDNSDNQRVGTVLMSQGMSVAGSEPQAQQLWMLDAMPSTPFDPGFPGDTGFRVRFENQPPRVYLDDGTLTPTRDDRIKRAVEQADQEMLGSGVFLPRCTEFIVEFSLGIIDRRNPGDNPNYGQPIWHGLRRYRNDDGAGRYDEGGNNADTEDTLFADYLGPTYDGADLLDRSEFHNDTFNIRGVFGDWFFEDGVTPQNGLDGEQIDSEMFQLMRVDHRVGPGTFSNVEDAVAAEYCFGYVYQDVNSLDPDDDTVRPWPWPKLIRVTMRFVDPSDLENERTYQVEFRVPTLAGEM